MNTPVSPRYFADPFVWRVNDLYYAIGTGAREATGRCLPGDRIFPLMTSRDRVRWTDAGRALEPPPRGLGTHFWAPEVAFFNGLYWLYYSVGFEDRQHQIRVASSPHPLGPYHDLKPLVVPTNLPFAIDPHPFQDSDGRWYLFYAIDSLLGERPGTVLAVDRLVEMDEAAGDEKVILRAEYDWERFRSGRAMYGGVYDWHTLEGPCVRKWAGLYYCFFSGGNWTDESYGVDYATAPHPFGPWGHTASSPRLLHTETDRLIGPGHQSIFTTPEGQEIVAFHAWNREQTARQMYLSPLVWTPAGPRCEASPGMQEQEEVGRISD